MTAKDYLSKTYRLEHEIQQKLDQIESLTNLAESCTSVITGIPRGTSNGASQMADTVCRIADLRDELNSELSQLVNHKTDAINTIYRVKHPDYRIILEKRYINCLSWEKIAEELGCSESWALKQHRNAIKAVDAVMKQDRRLRNNN